MSHGNEVSLEDRTGDPELQFDVLLTEDNTPANLPFVSIMFWFDLFFEMIFFFKTEDLNLQDILKGHEHYFRWLLLLFQACPVVLKPLVIRELRKRNITLDDVLLSKYSHLLKKCAGDNHKYKFAPSESYNTEVSSWDSRMLCSFILVLFESDTDAQLIDSVKCIFDQMNDIETYSSCTSVDCVRVKENTDRLREELLQMCDHIDEQTKFSFNRLIYSFTLEPLTVYKHLIEQLTKTIDDEPTEEEKKEEKEGIHTFFFKIICILSVALINITNQYKNIHYYDNFSQKLFVGSAKYSKNILFL